MTTLLFYYMMAFVIPTKGAPHTPLRAHLKQNPSTLSPTAQLNVPLMLHPIPTPQEASFFIGIGFSKNPFQSFIPGVFTLQKNFSDLTSLQFLIHAAASKKQTCFDLGSIYRYTFIFFSTSFFMHGGIGLFFSYFKTYEKQTQLSFSPLLGFHYFPLETKTIELLLDIGPEMHLYFPLFSNADFNFYPFKNYYYLGVQFLLL